MKKTLAALLCALVLLLPFAAAESGVPFQTPEPTQAPPAEDVPGRERTVEAVENALSINFRGETVLLNFDSDPYYTTHENGLICASFFIEMPEALYETYLMFPDTVVSGQVIDDVSMAQAQLIDPGIVFSYISDTEDIYCLASQYEDGAFPAGSSYSIAFDEVTPQGTATTYAGTFQCTLVAVDEYYNPLPETYECSGSFHFTLDSALNAAPQLPDFGGGNSGTVPALPSGPSLVTPPDAQKI